MDIKFFVPFETAKALKEKGYPQAWATRYYDTFDGETSLLINRDIASCVLVGNKDSPYFEKLSKSYTAAPTYHEVIDWLESKGIRVFAHYYLAQKEWVFVIEDFKRLKDNAGFFKNREQALNAAILKALEMI